MKYALVVLLLMFSITDANAYRVVYYRHYHPYHRSYYRTYYTTVPTPYYQTYYPYRPYCLVRLPGGHTRA
jgi:hypothetical protein